MEKAHRRLNAKIKSVLSMDIGHHGVSTANVVSPVKAENK